MSNFAMATLGIVFTIIGVGAIFTLMACALFPIEKRYGDDL